MIIYLLGKCLEVEELSEGAVLRETDLYLSTSETWQPCPCPGLTLQPGALARWVRPVEPTENKE